MRYWSDALLQLPNIVVEHAEYERVREKLLTDLAFENQSQILVVVGLSGVGKSRLLTDVDQRLISHVREAAARLLSPPAIVTTPPPSKGMFDWRTFYTNSMKSLNEPDADGKRDLSDFFDPTTRERPVTTPPHPSVSKLQDMLINTIAAKRPIAFLIDEAQHLANVTRGERVGQNLDVIKFVADQSRVNVVLGGTIAARQMLYHNAQLSRRVSVTYFHRYPKTPGGIGQIVGSWSAIIEALDLPVDDAISGEEEMLYDHTLGCVGVLVQWLERTIRLAKRKNSRKITLDSMYSRRLSGASLNSMFREAVEHEQVIEAEDVFEYPTLSEAHGETVPNRRFTKGHKRTPGRRNPHRDPAHVKRRRK